MNMKMYDKSRIYWTKAIVEEFVELGNLTKTEEAVFRMRAKEFTVTEISLKLHLSESTVKRIISKVKAKYDAVQTNSPLLPPRRYSYAEKYMDSH